MSNQTTAAADESEFTAASALARLAQDDRRTETEDNYHARISSGDSNNEEEDFTIPQRFTKSGRKRAVPFTIKLMKVLSDKEYTDIITWMPSGKSFNILNPKVFVAEVLPENFKTAKYSSFTRKLHRWGFMRHYRGEEAGAFYHKDFQRGRLDLVEQMTCHKGDPPKSPSAVSAAVWEKAFQGKAAAPPAKPAVAVKTCAVVKPVPLKPQLPTASATATTRAACPPTPQRAPVILTTAGVACTPTPQRTPVTLSNMAMAANAPMAPRLPPAPSAAAAHGSLGADRLNAVIEAEVNRRIRERVNAVALSRQAFAISAMRQQHLTLDASTASHVARAYLLQKQAGAFKNTVALGSVSSSSTMGYRALTGEGQPMPGAPPTNIQGARTA